jgi:hypothetical protein
MSDNSNHSLRVPSSVQLVVDSQSAAISNGPTLSNSSISARNTRVSLEHSALSYCNCGDSKNLETLPRTSVWDAIRVLEQLRQSELIRRSVPHLALRHHARQLLAHISANHHGTFARRRGAHCPVSAYASLIRHGSSSRVWEFQRF